MINDTDIDALSTCTAYDREGNKLGRVAEVYLDNENDVPAWVTVHTGLFGSRHSFVPLDEATVDGQHLRLPYDKATVTAAPAVNDTDAITPEDETALYGYYRREVADARPRPPDERHESPESPDEATPEPTDRTASEPREGETQASNEDSAQPASEPRGPRLRKRTVTELQTVNIPVRREEYYVDANPDETDKNRDEQ